MRSWQLREAKARLSEMVASTRREKLRLWLETELPGWFEERVLPVDSSVADRWGRLLAGAGRSVPAIDGLLAATALHHGLRLVTRDVADFTLPGLEVVDPWGS